MFSNIPRKKRFRARNYSWHDSFLYRNIWLTRLYRPPQEIEPTDAWYMIEYLLCPLFYL